MQNITKLLNIPVMWERTTIWPIKWHTTKICWWSVVMETAQWYRPVKMPWWGSRLSSAELMKSRSGTRWKTPRVTLQLGAVFWKAVSSDQCEFVLVNNQHCAPLLWVGTDSGWERAPAQNQTEVTRLGTVNEASVRMLALCPHLGLVISKKQSLWETIYICFRRITISSR